MNILKLGFRSLPNTNAPAYFAKELMIQKNVSIILDHLTLAKTNTLAQA